MMTGLAGSFPSSSDAPVCASLVWAAFAKSGLFAHACEDDQAMTTSDGERPQSPRAHCSLSL